MRTVSADTRIAKVIQQRGLVGADDADNVADIFNEFGQGSARRISGFSCKAHGGFLCGWWREVDVLPGRERERVALDLSRLDVTR